MGQRVNELIVEDNSIWTQQLCIEEKTDNTIGQKIIQLEYIYLDRYFLLDSQLDSDIGRGNKKGLPSGIEDRQHRLTKDGRDYSFRTIKMKR